MSGPLRTVSPYAGAARPQAADFFFLRIVSGDDGLPRYATGEGPVEGEFVLDSEGKIVIQPYDGTGLRARTDGADFTIYGET